MGKYSLNDDRKPEEELYSLLIFPLMAVKMRSRMWTSVDPLMTRLPLLTLEPDGIYSAKWALLPDQTCAASMQQQVKM